MVNNNGSDDDDDGFSMFYHVLLPIPGTGPFSDAPNLNFLEANSPPLCILPWKKDEKRMERRWEQMKQVTFSLRSLVYTYINYNHFIISWYIPYCLILAMLPRINIVHQNFTLNGLELGDSGRAVLRWSSVNFGNVWTCWVYGPSSWVRFFFAICLLFWIATVPAKAFSLGI